MQSLLSSLCFYILHFLCSLYILCCCLTVFDDLISLWYSFFIQFPSLLPLLPHSPSVWLVSHYLFINSSTPSPHVFLTYGIWICLLIHSNPSFSLKIRRKTIPHREFHLRTNNVCSKYLAELWKAFCSDSFSKKYNMDHPVGLIRPSHKMVLVFPNKHLKQFNKWPKSWNKQLEMFSW